MCSFIGCLAAHSHSILYLVKMHSDYGENAYSKIMLSWMCELKPHSIYDGKTSVFLSHTAELL